MTLSDALSPFCISLLRETFKFENEFVHLLILGILKEFDFHKVILK